MELMAAIAALESIASERRPIQLWTDSQYVRTGITTWIAGWKRKGWKTAAGQPVKNVDLWQRLDAAAAMLAEDGFELRRDQLEAFQQRRHIGRRLSRFNCSGDIVDHRQQVAHQRLHRVLDLVVQIAAHAPPRVLDLRQRAQFTVNPRKALPVAVIMSSSVATRMFFCATTS